MNKIVEEILCRIYYATDYKISFKGDYRVAILSDILKDLHEFTSEQLKTAVHDIKRQKLIENKKDYEGSVLVSLSERGMLRVINFSFRKLNDKKEKWDGKWRMIASDIPEEYRKGRDALRYRFKSGGFYELQKSLFLYPYDCEKEILALIRLFKLEKYVRFAILESIDNQENIKRIFKLE